jgi:hypothetical protein
MGRVSVVQLNVGETRKIARGRSAKRDPQEVVHTSGKPAEWKLADEKGELWGVRVDPACERLYAAACREDTARSGAIDEVS